MAENPAVDGVFVVDVEAAGRTPATALMTEFAVVHLITGASFYGHLYRSRPSDDNPAVPVVDDDAAGRPVTDPWWVINGKDPSAAVRASELAAVAVALSAWLDETVPGRRTLISDNNGFDAMWLNCFTDEQLGEVLFGHSSRRIGDFYAGTRGKWNDQSSWKRLRRTRHTHHPLDDARGNVEALRTLLGIDTPT